MSEPAVLLQYLFAGITVGGIYAIVAIGFNLIYNATGIINFAQGEFVMLGAMTAITLAAFVPLPLAVFAAVLITMLLGALVEMLCIRWLNSPSVLRMVIITIGASIVIRELALHLWDEKVHALPFFTGDECSSLAVGGARVSPQVFWVLGTVALLVIGLQLFFRYTWAGRAMRAGAANRAAARLCGIDVRNLVTLSFAVSAGIAALAGCVISPLTQTTYDCGAALAVKGFTVAIFGGMGKMMAAVGAGLLLGIIEAFSTSLIPQAYRDVVSLTILLLVLVGKPTGIFAGGKAARLREF